jgi:hypothetical protein
MAKAHSPDDHKGAGAWTVGVGECRGVTQGDWTDTASEGGIVMYRFAVKAVLVLSLFVISVGCYAPIYNVMNQPIAPSGGKPKTLEEVKAAIVSAGETRGWIMKEVGPGHLEGRLHIRVHIAVVDIKYSTTSYSITYKDSSQLNYDGTQIHMEYNNWIKDLQEGINNRLKFT